VTIFIVLPTGYNLL